MNERQIDQFFSALAESFPHPARVIVTGAALGAILGSVRPSRDIDFAIRPLRRSEQRWQALEEAIRVTETRTGIPANYAEDIDRWGAITLMDYPKHTLPYKRFGTIDVRLMEPAYWAIGKLTRYLATDIQDLVSVLKARRTPLRLVLRTWATALRKSPRSDALGQFRDHVEHFLSTQGPAIWGKGFSAENAIRLFRQAARAV